MALPRYLAEKAIDLFAQKFLFVYKDHEISMEDILCGGSLGTGNKHGYYGVCTACRQAFEYHDVENVGGKKRIKDVCPCCDAELVIKKGWYGKKTLSDCFYLQAWEARDYDYVVLHEAIIKVWNYDNWQSYSGPKELQVYDLRSTDLRPGKCETFRWNQDKPMRWASVCSDYEASGYLITNGSNYYNAEAFVKHGEVMGLEDLEGTFLAPFARCVSDHTHDQEKADYIIRMAEEPMTEILYKQGFKRIASDRAHGQFKSHNTAHLMFGERSPKRFIRNVGGQDEVAKVTKVLMDKNVVRGNIDLSDLECICSLVQKRKNITSEQILETYHASGSDFQICAEILSLLPAFGVEKITNYIKKQKRSTYTYRDYLSMCRRNGEDLSDDQVAFPKNLNTAHDNQVKKLKILESMAAEKKVAMRYENLVSAGYSFEYKGLIALVPKGAKDIQNEGTALSHCVGNYIDSHMKGLSTIIFIRSAETPEKSYFTLEINPKTMKFVQCYGYKNRKTGIKGVTGFGQRAVYVPEIGEFLEHYKEHLEETVNKKKEMRQRCRITA